jgi:hypothetical protein
VKDSPESLRTHSESLVFQKSPCVKRRFASIDINRRQCLGPLNPATMIGIEFSIAPEGRLDRA